MLNATALVYVGRNLITGTSTGSHFIHVLNAGEKKCKDTLENFSVNDDSYIKADTESKREMKPKKHEVIKAEIFVESNFKSITQTD